MPPKVSIIVPFYNAEATVSSFFERLRAMSLNDWEAVCVNDGSTDATRTLLDEEAARDSRIIVFHQSNTGPGQARNFAMDHAQGDFLAFCDADDYFLPEVLQKALQTAVSHQSDTVFLRILHIWPNGRTRCHHLPDNPWHFPEVHDADRRFFLTHIASGPYSHFLRRSFQQKNKIYFYNGRCGEDQLLHWKSCLLTQCADLLPEPAYVYNRRTFSDDSEHYRHYTTEIIDVWDEIAVFLRDTGLMAAWCLDHSGAKLADYFINARRTPPDARAVFYKKMTEHMTPADWELLANHSSRLSRRARSYFLSRFGSFRQKLIHTPLAALDELRLRIRLASKR
ncbi:MAG: glycosyltransferase family 2 protein [Planctomycetia bacterium]|nr:glycosyltransferase family 2 protein [Planctomycetia bacterium]